MKECPACHLCFPDHVNACPSDSETLIQSLTGEPIIDGRYQLEQSLGRGGMGIVFRAHHIYLKTAHAIKVILPDLVGNDPSLVTRFRQEAMAVAAIRHPNVVAVTDFGIARGSMPFLVMELIEGRSLHDILNTQGRFSPERALEIMEAVCAGVSAAHARGIVHRDLKPLNIMLHDDVAVGEALKVLDFGLAKIKSSELLASFVQAQTTGPVGSPFYMAPEQWSDTEPDHQTDIYSLGIILYQMLAGDVPFKGSSAASIMNKHLTDEPPSLMASGVRVGPQIERVVRRALEKDPAERPPSVETFANELREAVAYETLGQTHIGVIEKSQPADSTNHVSIPSPDNGQNSAQFQLTGVDAEEGVQNVLEWPRSITVEEDAASPLLSETGIFTDVEDQSKHEQEDEPPPQTSTFKLPSPAKQSRLLVPIIAAAIFLLSLSSFAIYRFFRKPLPANPVNVSSVIAERTKEIKEAQEAQKGSPLNLTKPEMIRIDGGEFMMGRSDVSPQSENAYDLNQWPAHRVAVKSFLIDKTEVTNAEYADFVREKNYPAPEDWIQGSPPQGQEQWPVRNVSFLDAQKFAEWRSGRDDVQYRLPTEQEWEYTARSNGKHKLYPWGDAWLEAAANVETDSPTDVGSHPNGASSAGAHDMIGNVWEWTSTVVFIYPGNKLIEVQPDRKDNIVIRGGSYKSKPTGSEAITATRRQWVPPSTKQPHIGFRLVRDDS